HNRRWPIASLLEVLRDDQARRPRRRSFLEYVLLAGVNDGEDDARRLGELLAGLNVQLNLIPQNAFPESPYAAATRARTLRFQRQLTARALKSIVRWPRGADVAGACGQLALRGVPA